MSNRVTISNLALQKIGADDQLVDPDDDSDAARSIKVVWDEVRKRCLRGGKHAPKWNFAKTYAELGALAASQATVPYGWSSLYKLPAKFVRMIEIIDPSIAIDDYQIIGIDAIGDCVLTRTTGPLRLWYIRDVEEPALWDDLFVDTFAARLAYQVCDRVTGDRGRKKDCDEEFRANLIDAAGVDAMENPPVETEESDWVLARYERL